MLDRRSCLLRAATVRCIAGGLFVRDGANALGLSSMNVVSGAGHDAVYVARVAPAAMIFVPYKDGISHNEIEDARQDHLEAGCNVLLQAMLRAVGGVRA